MARWVVLGFAAIWAPFYWREYGWRNFLQLCDIAVFLTLAGLWRGNALLLSSQAVGAMVVDILWAVDFFGRAFTGRHPIGGTDYMFMDSIPLFVRALSLFHIVWPLLLLWAIRRSGYDRRGWILQAAIAGAVLLVSRLGPHPSYNVNFAWKAPFIDAPVGPAPVHLAACLLGLVLGAYLPTHVLLARCVRA
ncbi:MAG: membrane-associated protein [Planctomycetes bacterium]|nr:membrane-associated protein [Planctomycetota bacterium]